MIHLQLLTIHVQLKLTGKPPMQYSAAQTLGPLNQASMPIIAGPIDEQITSLTSLTTTLDRYP